MMATEKTPKSFDQIKHVEDLFSPELFATEASAFSIHAGVVTITLASNRYDNSVSPAVLNQVVVGRIVLPPAGAKSLAVGLYNFWSNNGMEPVRRPKEATDVQ
jgi:hypothetical protein